jgi:hypothetical protein
MPTLDDKQTDVVIERRKARLVLAAAILNARRGLSELEAVSMACARALDEQEEKNEH